VGIKVGLIVGRPVGKLLVGEAVCKKDGKMDGGGMVGPVEGL
jgi:hypothetical protein